MWRLDAIGIDHPSSCGPVHVTPERVGERYEVRLPWLDDRRPMFTFPQAERRLPKTADPGRREAIAAVFRDYEASGIVEPASPDGGSYIPYHAVPSKGKIRVVYDASALPWRGPSLNECLSSGPNLLEDLLALLLRFRAGVHPVIADVEKAFLMVGVAPEDRDCLKIVVDGRSLRFARVPFGLICGPYLLLVTIQKVM